VALAAWFLGDYYHHDKVAFVGTGSMSEFAIEWRQVYAGIWGLGSWILALNLRR
jgi:hypothetical protein